MSSTYFSFTMIEVWLQILFSSLSFFQRLLTLQEKKKINYSSNLTELSRKLLWKKEKEQWQYNSNICFFLYSKNRKGRRKKMWKIYQTLNKNVFNAVSCLLKWHSHNGEGKNLYLVNSFPTTKVNTFDQKKKKRKISYLDKIQIHWGLLWIVETTMYLRSPVVNGLFEPR